VFWFFNYILKKLTLFVTPYFLNEKAK